jgi:hypothetical protein
MERPTQVDIGPFAWEIVYDSEELRHLHRVGAEDMWGCTLVDQHKMLIDDSRSLRAVKETVLHEVFHAILATYGIRMPDGKEENFDKEERFVLTFSPMVFDVFLRNPKLTGWLFHE